MSSGRRKFIYSLGAAAVVVIADYLLLLTDSIIAGRVLGETALGAMNLLMPAFSVVMFFAWLLASGASTIYLAAVRRGDEHAAAKVAGQGVLSACLVSLVLAAVLFGCKGAYLAFMGPSAEVGSYAGQYWTWYPAILAFQCVGLMLLYLVFVRGGELVCVKAYAVQLLANLVLSYGLCMRMGMAGISLGTAASYLVWLVALAVLLRGGGAGGVRFARGRFDPKLAFRAVRTAFGESFVWLLHAFLFFCITKYILLFWGSESLPVCAVVFFIIRLTLFFFGVGIAMRPLESARRDAADVAEIGRVFRIGAISAFLAMAFVAILFLVAPEPFIDVFGIETADLIDRSKFAARVTVGGLFLIGLAVYLPLRRRVCSSSVPQARLNYLQSYVLSRMAAEPSAQMFNLTKLFRLRQGIDLERLSAALVAAGEAHQALRTVLRTAPDGEIVQRLELAKGSVRCPVVRIAESELMAKRSELAKEFDAFGKVLFNATIFDCGGGRAYLLSDFHHLICDGYSFPLILADAHRAWDGETLTSDAYYDVLARREERAALPLAVTGRNYMRELLRHRTFTTLPPADFDGAPGFGSLELPLALPANFEDYLVSRHVTRHHVFLAATVMALKQITGADNLLIDWVFHGRVSKDELKTVGAFMVDLPLFFEGTDEMAETDVISDIKRATFNGIRNVNVYRDVTDCNPTGQERLTFIYQDEWGELMSPGPVRSDGPYAWMIEETIPLSAPRAATENPFNVEIMEHRDATRLFIEYDTGRYSEATVRRYAEHFKESLDRILTS